MIRSARSPVSILLALVAIVSGTARADVTEVDEAALARLIADGAVVVDVRREDEWRTRGVLDGAHGLTFFDERGRYDIDAWLKGLSALVAPEETLVLICAHGVRSKRIADLLDSRLGFDAVHNVTDGFEGWLAAGGERRPFDSSVSAVETTGDDAGTTADPDPGSAARPKD